MKGIVRYGVRNIFIINTKDGDIECRLKGKVLKQKEKTYNPLCPGDIVSIIPVDKEKKTGIIEERKERKNHFSRWNKKRNAPQSIAANIDLLVCVLSAESPPFRPRFADRVLVSCERDGIKPIVLLNKVDLGLSSKIEGRMNDYKRIGYDILYCSAKTPMGIEEIASIISEKTVAFLGQSGVGKSTILNMIEPKLNLATGEISSKYNRGTHTTTLSILLPLSNGSNIIDSPGIRSIDIYGIDADELDVYFPEFRDHRKECSFSACSHVHEPNCAVIEAVESGAIHPDRYESYIRIYRELEERKRY